MFNIWKVFLMQNPSADGQQNIQEPSTSSILPFKRFFSAWTETKKVYLKEKKEMIHAEAVREFLSWVGDSQQVYSFVTHTSSTQDTTRGFTESSVIAFQLGSAFSFESMKQTSVELGGYLQSLIHVPTKSVSVISMSLLSGVFFASRKMVTIVAQIIKKALTVVVKITRKNSQILRHFGRFILPVLSLFLTVSKYVIFFTARLIRIIGKTLWRFYRSSTPQEFFGKLAISSIVVSIVLLALLNYPTLLMRVFPNIYGEKVVTAMNHELPTEIVYIDEPFILPPKDENLPKENRLVIEKIGVDTLIQEHPDEGHEEVLKKGVWRIPDFAAPDQNVQYPSILVAHRFGYLKWSNQFRKQNSFYNLDDTKVGDRFEVVWDQRRFIYEIYAEEEGKEISDYGADMILYTCKHLNSPIRIFRYAKRVDGEALASME